MKLLGARAWSTLSTRLRKRNHHDVTWCRICNQHNEENDQEPRRSCPEQGRRWPRRRRGAGHCTPRACSLGCEKNKSTQTRQDRGEEKRERCTPTSPWRESKMRLKTMQSSKPCREPRTKKHQWWGGKGGRRPLGRSIHGGRHPWGREGEVGACDYKPQDPPRSCPGRKRAPLHVPRRQ